MINVLDGKNLDRLVEQHQRESGIQPFYRNRCRQRRKDSSGIPIRDLVSLECYCPDSGSGRISFVRRQATTSGADALTDFLSPIQHLIKVRA
jgi:hypothetical protein